MYYKQNNVSRHQSRLSRLRRPLLMAAIAVTCLVLVILSLELTNTTHLFHKQKATSSTIPAASSNPKPSTSATKDTASTGSSTSASSNTPATTPAENPKSPGANSSTEPPRVPAGNFVSNHHPSLSNTETAPSKVQSVCNTTPGATCTITFTSQGVTKTLEAKVANGDGVVIWDWDVVTAGFVPGSWQITATATLNNQTKSAQDSQQLEIQS